MNQQVRQLLEKVQLGEISEKEAERQYLSLTRSDGDKQTAQETNRNAEVNAQATYQGTRVYDDRKIECLNRMDNPESRLFIFLPFGFGNETLSWSWKKAFSEHGRIEVWLMGASDIADWQQLIDYLTDHMEPLCHLPFMVYGHSMGGIVAYETLVVLQQRYQLSPMVFMPSSVSPPGIFERLKVLPPVYEIDDWMPMPDCRDLLEKSQIILPLKSGVKPMSDVGIRCDLALIKTYRHPHENQVLKCPVIALQANNDVLVKDPVSISLWKNYTQGFFGFQELEGTHLYFMNPPQSLFRTIKSFLNQEEINKPADSFRAKTYRLVSFETGTDEVHIYPFGINPKGYLIYQQDGGMAAHIWSLQRNSHGFSAFGMDSDPAQITEQLLTYLSYTGDFQEGKGVIYHHVQASTDPNFDKDCLIRYYSINGNYITLMTAPLTTKNSRQSKSSSYSKLVWEEVSDEKQYPDHWSTGSWQITAYEEDDKSVLGEYPTGRVLLTQEGYVSIVAARQNRNRPFFDNLILARREEIVDAVESCRSFCGQIDKWDDNNFSFTIEEGLFDTRIKSIRMNLASSQYKLELLGLRSNKDSFRFHCMLRQNEEQRFLTPA